MSTKHQTPEYRRNARIIRERVKAQHRREEPVICWRGGGPILPGMRWDVGHLPTALGSALHELAPEHRHKMPGCCDGNRTHGARAGAAITNARRAPIKTTGDVTTWRV